MGISEEDVFERRQLCLTKASPVDEHLTISSGIALSAELRSAVYVPKKIAVVHRGWLGVELKIAVFAVNFWNGFARFVRTVFRALLMALNLVVVSRQGRNGMLLWEATSA